MEFLCEYVIANADYNIDERIGTNTFSCDDFDDLDVCVDVVSQYLGIDKSLITVNAENVNTQRATVISVKFKDRDCKFYGHFDTQRDYICVALMPVS
jgi:hypothetical protein